VGVDRIVGEAPVPGVDQLGEPAVDERSPLLGGELITTGCVALGLRLGGLLGDGAPVNSEAPGDLGLLPASLPVNEYFYDIYHSECSPCHGAPVLVDEVAANATRSPSGGSSASEVRDYLNAGVLDNLNANTLSCGIT